MRCFFILVPVLLCTAQTSEKVNINTANWVNSIILAETKPNELGNKFKGNDAERPDKLNFNLDTANWLNTVILPETNPNELGNKFKGNDAETPDKLNFNLNTANWLNTFILPETNPNELGNKSGTNGEKGSEFNLNESEAAKLHCETEDGKRGKCVKPNFCAEPQKEVDTTTFFDLRASGCSHHLLQCCPLNQTKEEPEPTIQLPEGCGWSNPGGYSLRTSPQGEYANFGEFPWMVAVLKKPQTKKWREDNIGGGSLIHPKVVITVAHKVLRIPPNELQCRAGDWDIQTLNEFLPYQERNVTKILIHDQFNSTYVYYDAALLIMETPFVLEDAPHIGVVCLAEAMPPPGTLCYSMGWGSYKFTSDEFSATLKKVELPTVDPTLCQNQLRNTRLGAKYQLHSSLTCAGGNGKDTCTGDGGSSLVCPFTTDDDSTRFLMYGMVVYGVGCGEHPGVYAKIPSMVNWVDQMMDKENLAKGYTV